MDERILPQRIGENLRRHRDAAGVSQEEFAATLGMNRAHVELLERGEAEMTLQSLEDLASKLGIDPAELLRP